MHELATEDQVIFLSPTMIRQIKMTYDVITSRNENAFQ